jgi:phage baseplate assembly protein W
MARPVYKYQPINESPDVAIGIPLPFNKASKARPVSSNYASGSIAGNFVLGSTYTTEEQSISNFKNLLLTRKGERIMQPNFGTNIYNLLFENNTQDIRSTIKKTLTKDVNFWLPYITINDIKLVTSADMHQLTIAIHFQVTTVGSNLVINVVASENSLQVSDAVGDTSLQQINITTAGGY